MHPNFHENDYLINLTYPICYQYLRNMFEISHEIHLVDIHVLSNSYLFNDWNIHTKEYHKISMKWNHWLLVIESHWLQVAVASYIK